MDNEEKKYKFKVNSRVLVTAKVLVRSEKGEMKTMKFAKQKGTIKKLCGLDHFYVKTKYGIHYLHESKVSTLN